MGRNTASLSRMRAATMLVLALLVSACAGGGSDFGAWLDEAPRTVRLVVADSPVPATKYYVLQSRRAEGAAVGAATGGGVGLEGAPNCSGDSSGLCVVFWLALLPVMILGGAVIGAVTADPAVADSWPLADSETTMPLAGIVAEIAPPVRNRAGDSLARLIRDSGEHTVIIVPAGEADATVSLKLLGVGLRGDAGEDPQAWFQMEFAVTVVWSVGIKDDIFRFDSRRARLSEWRAEDFRLVREAISGLEDEFVHTVEEDWFGRPPGPAP